MKWRGLHLMALRTINPLVPAFEWEMGLIVVKFGQSGIGCKRLFHMAFLAIDAQLVVVRIAVATIAILKSNPCKFLKFPAAPGFFLVAFRTTYGFMPASQRKVGFIVIELRCRSKFIGIVAFSTIGGKGLLVVILMAGEALFFQPKEGSLPFF